MIVLDTHALIWWINNDKHLSRPAAQTITEQLERQGDIIVSSITAWEIALLIDKGRLALSMDVDEWLDTVESIESVSFMPVTRRLAVQSTRLPGTFHQDPADRMIVALAREMNAVLITADSRIQDYPHVRWLW